MYLLDTDTIIYSLKGNEAVKQNLRLHIEDPMKMSIITADGVILRCPQIHESGKQSCEG